MNPGNGQLRQRLPQFKTQCELLRMIRRMLTPAEFDSFCRDRIGQAGSVIIDLLDHEAELEAHLMRDAA